MFVSKLEWTILLLPGGFCNLELVYRVFSCSNILFKLERVGYDDIHVASEQPHLSEFGKDFGGGATIQRYYVWLFLAGWQLPLQNFSRNCTRAPHCLPSASYNDTAIKLIFLNWRNSRSNLRTRTLNEHDLRVWLLLSVIGKFFSSNNLKVIRNFFLRPGFGEWSFGILYFALFGQIIMDSG